MSHAEKHTGSFRRTVRRELSRYSHDWIYFFSFFLAPAFAFVLFSTLMSSSAPTQYPVGVVDQDNSSSSRQLVRLLSAFQMTDVTARYPDISQATDAVQRGTIYGFYYIPRHFAADANAQRQPKLSFYTNNSVLLAASMSMKDFKVASELASGSAQRTVLRARGYSDEQTMPLIQPITIDVHAISNPWISYGVYLNTTLLPAVMMMMILLTTAYSVGSELKAGTAREWLHTSGDSLVTALTGKLLPQTLAFFSVGLLCNAILYGYMHYPLNGVGLPSMLLATLLLILASQALGLFFIGMFPILRYGLSLATLWSVMSFSITGFTFPVVAMHPSLQALANMFPLRHFYCIYTDQALNGYPMHYSLGSYLALLAFLLLPFLVLKRLRRALLTYQYVP